MKKETLIKSAGIVGLGTFFSRILGLVRLQVIAYIFGYSPATDAFWIAFSIPNLLRSLLAEGALSMAFIPVFSEWLSLRGEKEAWKLANNVLNILMVFSLGAVALGIILAPKYIPYLAFGFRENVSQLGLTVNLTRFMFPFLFFISLGALAMAVLNCRGHFSSPALAPVFFNILVICSALFLTKRWGIYALGLGVTLGGIGQLLVQLPALISKGFRYHSFISLNDEGLRKIGKLFFPAVLSGLTLQVSLLINRIFASTLPVGGVSSLLYAMRLIQFPLGLFPIALSVAIFPRLSSLAARGDKEELGKTTSLGLRLVLFLLIPSSVGLVVMRNDLISLLFEHGAFLFTDTLLTAEALFYYCFGLFAMGGVMILTRAFYSLQDILTPLKVSVGVVAFNVVLNFLLISPLKQGGLALATSLSMILNLVVLFFLLRRKIPNIEGKKVVVSFLKVCLSAALMGTILFVVLDIFSLGGTPTFWYQLIRVVLVLLGGIGICCFFTYLLRVEELSLIARSLLGGEKYRKIFFWSRSSR